MFYRTFARSFCHNLHFSYIFDLDTSGYISYPSCLRRRRHIVSVQLCSYTWATRETRDRSGARSGGEEVES